MRVRWQVSEASAVLTAPNHLLHNKWDIAAAIAKACRVLGSLIAPDVKKTAASAAD